MNINPRETPNYLQVQQGNEMDLFQENSSTVYQPLNSRSDVVLTNSSSDQQQGVHEPNPQQLSSGLIAQCHGTLVTVIDTSKRPLIGCNHLRTVRPVSREFEIDLKSAACNTCGISAEKWMCLVCHKMFCGRYQNSHMVEHFRDTGHCVSMSLEDLSVWCYGCDQYLQHESFPLLRHFFSRMYELKFHERPQNVSVGDESILAPIPIHSSGCVDLDAVSNAYLKLKSLEKRCATCEANNVEHDVNMNFREDWMCLKCGGVYCGRYHHKHALHHYQLSNHPLSISFCDLSIWCYNCMQYIDHNSSPSLQQAYSYMQDLKSHEGLFP